MKITTKNIDKLIRTVKRSNDGLRVDTSFKCCSCNKKIRGNKYIAVLNGMGGFNYYHIKHMLEINNK